MKKISLIGFLLMFVVALFAQPCTSFYYFRKGDVFEKTVYDAKKEIIAMQEYRILVLDEHKDGTVTATVQAITIKDGKEAERTHGIFVCNGSALLISMGKAANGREVFVDYPANIKPGQALASDISFDTEAKVAGRKITVNCFISNRKVSSTSETVSTALGSWNCMKTGYDMTLRGSILGISIPIDVHVVEWFAPGFGIVRTDIYRGGKLHEQRLLTGIKNAGN